MGKRYRVAGFIYLVIGLAVIFHSLLELGLGTVKRPGPGFFPFICGVSIVVFSGAWLLSLSKGNNEEHAPFWGKGEWIRPTIAIVLTMAYAAIMDDFGFIPSTFIFLAAWQFWIEREKWMRNMVISIVGTISMYAIFQVLLAVPLPRGMLNL